MAKSGLECFALSFNFSHGQYPESNRTRCRGRFQAIGKRTWRQQSWTGPVKRNVLARIRRPLKLESESIDGTARRLAPGDDLSWAGLGSRWIDELWIFARYARRAGQGLGPGFDFAGDLGAPVGAIWRDLKSDPCAFDASDLPTFRKQRSDDGGKSTDLAAKDARQHLGLALVGAFIDEDARCAVGLSCPEIAFPSPHSDKAQIVEIDIAVMATSDVPEQNQLADAIVRGLGEGAGARNSTTAIVEPVSGDLPVWNLNHKKLRSPLKAFFQSAFAGGSDQSELLAPLGRCLPRANDMDSRLRRMSSQLGSALITCVRTALGHLRRFSRFTELFVIRRNFGLLLLWRLACGDSLRARAACNGGRREDRQIGVASVEPIKADLAIPYGCKLTP